MNGLQRRLLALMLHRSSRRNAGRRKASRGQALVEFALLITPLFMLLVVFATDVSTLLDDHLDIVYAARAGARVGSVIGNFAPSSAPLTADCAIIGAVQAALASSRNVQVTQITIYEANAQGQMVGSNEDVYSGNAVCNPDGTITPSATTLNWPPNGTVTPPTRDNTPFTEDSIGVSISWSYTFDFNLFNFPPVSSVDHAVMPIEVVTNVG